MQFSVLMSLYIQEKPSFLEQCLQSLEYQTLKANEIVIVFDGKLNNELENIVSKYLKKLPIKIVRLPKNVGLGNSLNIGLQHCSFEWIFRMDTDDICTKNRFEKQINFIKNNPDISVFGGQIIEFENNISDANSIKEVPTTEKEIKNFAKTRCPFNHMTIAYKKSIILNVGGYQHHLFQEDYNLWLRIIAQGYKTANISEILVYVRGGKSMISRRRGRKYIKSEWKLFQLKKQLKIQNFAWGFITFLTRSLPRILPIFVLNFLYNFFLRKKTKKQCDIF